MKKIIVFCLSFNILILNCALLLCFLGYANTDFNGFAVDSNNCLYIGKERRIEIYKNNYLINTINPPTSRAYIFSIQNDDTIILSTASVVYIMDLEGNIIRSYEDTYTQTYNSLKKTKNKFSTKDGEQYSVKHRFSRLEIVNSNNIQIYQMPLLDFIVRIVFVISFLGLWILIPILINRIKSDHMSHRGRFCV